MVLVGCKHIRLSDQVSDRRIIRNDHRGSGLKFVSELVGEVLLAQEREQVVRILPRRVEANDEVDRPATPRNRLL